MIEIVAQNEHAQEIIDLEGEAQVTRFPNYDWGGPLLQVMLLPDFTKLTPESLKAWMCQAEKLRDQVAAGELRVQTLRPHEEGSLLYKELPQLEYQNVPSILAHEPVRIMVGITGIIMGNGRA